MPNKKSTKKLGRPQKIYTVSDGFELISGTIQDLAYEFNVPKKSNIKSFVKSLGLAYKLVSVNESISYKGLKKSRIDS